MAWGNSWDMDKQDQKETYTYHYLGDQEPLKYLGTIELTDNLIFVCDTCEAIFDPGITGFQALIDAARQAKWKITFHIGKDGYAMCCPSCNPCQT